MKNLWCNDISIQLSMSISRKNRGLILTAVRVLATVRHAHQAGAIEISPAQILVLKLAAVYRVAACTIAFGDVSSLAHKLIDDPVEAASAVTQRRLRAGTKCSKAIAMSVSPQKLCEEVFTFHMFVVSYH